MEQKRLGSKGLVVLIGFCCMVPPLATDLYTPAMPAIAVDLATSEAAISSSVTAFFMSMAIGMLVWGPLSDKFGRKGLLLFSGALAVVSSICMIAAHQIFVFLLGRVLCGLASGGLVVIATAVIRDSYTGAKMTRILAITQAIGMVAPVVAPLLGGLILQFAHWRFLFGFLMVLFVGALVLITLLTETLPQEMRTTGNVFKSYAGMSRYLKMPAFLGFLLVACLLNAPNNPCIGLAAFIYEGNFGFSELQFSLVFAVLSLMATLGALVYMKVNGLSENFMLTLFLAITVLTGVALLLGGASNPVVFTIVMMPHFFAASYSRPYITNHLLQLTTTNVGAASSLITFSVNFFAASTLSAASVVSPDMSVGIMWAFFVCAALAVMVWAVYKLVASRQK